MTSFEQIVKRESTRFEKALKEAREAVLESRFPKGKPLTREELKKFEELLDNLTSSILLCSQLFFDRLPSPLKETRERSNWEVYLSALSFLARRYPQGEFRRGNLSLKEWEPLPETVDAYVERCLKATLNLAGLARDITRYCANYRKAGEIAKEYGPETENRYETLCRIYSSLKTWEKEEDFARFGAQVERASQDSFEVIIEGPIQLYLFIGEETWFLLLKVLSLERLSDFFSGKNRKELQDVRDLNRFVYETVESSQAYQLFKQLMKEVLRLYAKDLIVSQKELRNQFPTDELRRKYVARFEKGEIFPRPIPKTEY